ncbi:unnamed protein product [Calypogeia fissa]
MGLEDHSLTPEQLDFYDANGYLVLENFASEAECKAMIDRMGELVDTFDPNHGSVFSTTNQKQTTNEYFLESANNVSFFFEEKGFDEEHNLKQPKSLSINKAGHAMHDFDPVFREFSRSEKMKGLVASLGYKKPLPVQSMYIFKQPGIGGEVVPHQDSTFLYTEPHSTTAVWIALEDANKVNGCLWALPGSHKGGVFRRFIAEKDGVRFDNDPPPFDESKFVPLEMRAGSLVVLHGALLHQSFENTSAKSRHAYSVHVVEGDGTSYPKENWLQRNPSLPFEPLYVK